MKNIAFLKQGYAAKSRIKSYFCANRALLILFTILVVCALLTGIFTCVKNESIVGIKHINDFVLIKLFKRQISPFTFFVYRMFFCSLTILFICTVSNFRFFNLLIYPLVAYCAFNLGFNCTVFILLYGFSGIVNVLFAIFPFELFFLLIFVICATSGINRCFEIKRFGRCREGSFFSLCLSYGLPIIVICAVQSILLSFCYGSLIF